MESYITFWAEVSILALKKWFKFRGRIPRTEKYILHSLGGVVIHVNGGLQLLDFLVMQVTGSPNHLKSKLTRGYGTWSGCLAPGGPIAPEEGQ